MRFKGWKTATVSSGGTLSSAVDLEDTFRSLAILVPTIDSGTLSLRVADTYDGTYQDLYVISGNDGDDDQQLCSTTTGGMTIIVPFFGFQFVKVLMGGTAGADRTFKLWGFN
jgi:hypothetical protein